MNTTDREQKLDQEKAKYIARGYELTHFTRYSAVLEKDPVNVPLGAHILLTLFTLGGWLVFWLLAGLANTAPVRIRIYVDPDGELVVEKTAAGRTVEVKEP